MTRRELLGAAGAMAVGAAATAAKADGAPAKKDEKAGIRILGISCSPRKGKTTAQAVRISLEAAEQAQALVETELIDLGGMRISGWIGGAKSGQGEMPNDDFRLILPKLKDPAVWGLIVGSPVYFRSMSALCKAFLEQCALLRKPKLLWADKAIGALAVGAFRNGGQELVVQQIQTVLLCHEMMVVGGKPRAHQGATLWNAGAGDNITTDALGVDTAKLVGRRVAEAAVRLAGYGDIK